MVLSPLSPCLGERGDNGRGLRAPGRFCYAPRGRPMIAQLPVARLAAGTTVRYVGRSTLVVSLDDRREVALEPDMVGTVAEVDDRRVVVQFRNAYRAAFRPGTADFEEC